MVELSYSELDSYVRQICAGERVTYVEDQKEREVALLFHYPTSRDLVLAEHVYRDALKTAEEEGLLSIETMEAFILERGLYTDEDDQETARLQSRLEGQQAVLVKTTRVPARRDRLKGVIAGLEEKIQELASKKEFGFDITQERKASEEKFLFLTRKGVLEPFTGELFWKTSREFEDEPDFLFRKRVFVEYIVFAHGIRQDTIRHIARSNLWRLRYVTALKTGDSLFGLSIKDYTVDQLTLLYWSHYYQSIYDMMSDDQPPESIIEDDAALDAYMKDWQADRNRDAVASRAKKNKNYGQNSAWDYDETLVMRSNPLHEDIEYSETSASKAQYKGQKTIDAAPIGGSKKIRLGKDRKVEP